MTLEDRIQYFNPIEAELGKYYYIRYSWFHMGYTVTRELVDLLVGRDTNYEKDGETLLRFYQSSCIYLNHMTIEEMREVDNPFLGRLI